MANSYCIDWVTSQIVTSLPLVTHIYCLQQFRTHPDILKFSFRNAQQGVDIALVKENNPKILQDFPM